MPGADPPKEEKDAPDLNRRKGRREYHRNRAHNRGSGHNATTAEIGSLGTTAGKVLRQRINEGD